MIWLFAALWPDVLPARNDPALSLTVQAASSSPYTLKVMTIVALIFTPMVLIYQGWSYWVFRGRVSDATPGGYGQAVGRTVSRARDSARHPVYGDRAWTQCPLQCHENEDRETNHL